MRKSLLVVTGFVLLFAVEILRVYFIMPFPGSQHANTIDIAYFIDRHILLLRLIGLLMTVPAVWYLAKNGSRLQKTLLSVFVILFAAVFYLFNFRFLADKMFYQPREKRFADVQADTASKNRLIVGVQLNGEAKAYPIEVIGYHHQVRDTVGGQSIMVTYCTVCRTGRVYSPLVNGKNEQFRLVGMDHFNAMFEDATTKSWWQQATGTAIAGDLKGTKLTEIPSAQMRLGDWLAQYPNSMILQPDKNFIAKYDSLKGYDEGTIKGSLEHRDSASWKFKSWVVGVPLQGKSRAYDWNDLVQKKIISDTLAGKRILLTVEPNNKTFYVFAISDSLQFSYDAEKKLLVDNNTKNSWASDGECLSGPMKGTRLQPIQAYQEFWHSWQTFHPQTSTYQ